MRKNFTIGTARQVALLAGVGLAALTVTVPAYAQDAADPAGCVDADADGVCDPAAGADGSDTGTAIVVTGSRIARPSLDSPVPVTSIAGETIIKQGQTNIGDTLNDLPQLRSTFSQQNPGLGIGIAGLNLLDLRGLGTARTLVLVNGRRHVPADILNNAVSPDVNTIPNDLIERVDIVTGGNSAIYGSDAIAGVVNFVLRRDYEGVQLRGNVGIADEGFGFNSYLSAMAGMNFGDGRGNVTLHGEYAHQDRVFGSQIPAFRRNDGFGTIDLDTGGLPNNSDGFPDTTFFEDFRSASIHRFGLIPITQRTGSPACGQGFVATNGPASTTGGSSFNCTYIFTSDGQLQAQTGTRFGSGIIGSIIGGNGQNSREGRQLSVIPEQDRININLLSHYTFSDAAEVFLEAKWNRVDALGSNAGPSFIQGTQTQFDFRERTRLDNPFLTAAQRATIGGAILASNCNTSLTVSCPATTNIGTADAPVLIPGNLTAADRAAIAAGTYRFVIARNLLDSGIRDEEFRRETYRIVGGLRGEFNDDWRYEISANYGEFKENTTTYGYLDRQRFMLALDAGRNPLTGQIQCRSQFDPTAAVPLTRGGLSPELTAGLAAKLAGDIAACVPYNPYGGLDNRASANYFTYNASHEASLSQLVLSGFVSGDSSGFFNLPGGAVRFAVGAEYRREKAFYQQDTFVEQGYTNAVVIPTFDPEAFEVKEAFAEIQIPILSDVPFFEELTVSGAGRIADYNSLQDYVYAYNGGVEWSPFDGVRFRGNYARAVRAPNVSETGFPLVPNFAPGFADPCSPARINTGTSTRAANCQTDLGALLGNLTDTTYSLPVLSGSNPNLDVEKSDSYTVGAVFTPRFLPGLSLTVDYYNIKVSGIIASLSAQQIANLCYDQATLANVFCGQFQRYRGTGPGSLGETPGQIQGNTLIQAPLNFAKREREGIDTQVTYRTTFGQDFRFYTNLIYTHNFRISNFEDPTRPEFENRILEELGDPKDEFRWDVDLGFREFTFGYRMRYIGPMFTQAYETQNPLPTACTGATCPPTNLDATNFPKYGEVFYHDVRFEWDIDNADGNNRFQIYAGVDNVLGTQPPLGSTATGTGSAIYSARGRNLYAGVRARF